MTLSLAQPSLADSGELLDNEQRTELMARMGDYGVPAGTQAALLRKLEAGEPWDSLAGSEAVDVRTVVSAQGRETIAVFEDGSVAVTTMEEPQATASGSNPINPGSVSGCTVTGVGTVKRTLRNCLVEFDVLLTGMSFRANYTYTYVSLSDPVVKAASITAVSSPKAFGTAVRHSNIKVSITQQNAASGVPARAHETSTCLSIVDSKSQTCYFDLIVPIGGYTLAYTKHS